jgi:hypothetical protein
MARKIRAALREQELLALTESRGSGALSRHGTGGREVEDPRQD